MTESDVSPVPDPAAGGGGGTPPSGVPAMISRYEIIRERGRGAMGVVYEAVDPKIGRRVALKVLHHVPGVPATEVDEFRNRFFREARTAGMLSHPNIVVIHDVDSDEQQNITYMAMEYLKGEDVYDLLRKGVRFTREQAVDICTQVAEGLDHAHRQGVIHRDVKPANLMLLEDGTVKITDFGIAKISTSNLTRTGQFLGTPNYMSPEQVIGHVIDGRSDLFSLGIIFYELLTGEKPFMGSSLTTITYQIVNVDPIETSKIQPGIPKAYDVVAQRMLKKAPDERYQTGKEVAEALRALRDSAAAASSTMTSRPSSASGLVSSEPTMVGLGAALGNEPTTDFPMRPPTGTAVSRKKGMDWRLLAGLGAVVAIVAATLVLKQLYDDSGTDPVGEPPQVADAGKTPATSGVEAPASGQPTPSTTGLPVPAPGPAPDDRTVVTPPAAAAPEPGSTVVTTTPPKAGPVTPPTPRPTKPAPAPKMPTTDGPPRANRGPVVAPPAKPGGAARLDLGAKTITGADKPVETRPTATVNFFFEHKLKTGGRISVQVDKREVFALNVGPVEKKAGRRRVDQGRFEVPDGRHVIAVCLASEDLPDSPRCPYKEHSFVGHTTVTVRAELLDPPMAPPKFSFSLQ